MRFSRRRSLAALAVAVPALITGMATSASAGCASGYSCIWEDSGLVTNGNSLGWIRFSNFRTETGAVNYNGTTMNGHDNASSMHNNHATAQVWYFTDPRCGGVSFNRNAGQNDGDFSNDTPAPGGYFNDKIDSGAFLTYIGSCQV
jgi:hypothetical protein